MPNTWTYSGDPQASKLDGVRFLCGDTNSADPQIFDSEVNFLIATYVNIFKAAAYACKSIASKYARLVDKSVGDLHISYSQRQKSYEALSEYLLRESALRKSVPQAGGISRSDKLANKLDPDIVQPKFTKSQFAYPQGVNTPNNVADIGPFDVDS